MSFIEGIAKIVLGYEISEYEASIAQDNLLSMIHEGYSVFDISQIDITKVYELGEFKKAYFGYTLAEARHYNGGIEVNLQALKAQADDLSTDLIIDTLNLFGIKRTDEPKVYLLADTSD